MSHTDPAVRRPAAWRCLVRAPRRATGRSLLAASALLASATAAFARDLRVPSAEFPTLQSAADAAQSGDRILLGSGSFRENVTLGVGGVAFVGKGALWDGTVSSTVAGPCLVATGDGISLAGITFRNGSGTQVRITGKDAVVDRCVSRHSGGFLSIAGDGARVTSCTVSGCLQGPAIEVQGAQALVDRCSLSNGALAVFVGGSDATVSNCVVRGIRFDAGVVVSGARPRVLRNRITSVDETALRVVGDDAVVESNVLSASGDELLRVTGERPTLRKNRMTGAYNGGVGCRIDTSEANVGGLIEGNTVSDCAGTGIGFRCAGVTARGNTALRCGLSGGAAFSVVSFGGNTFESNKAVDCSGDGFACSSAGNTFRACAASACVDGFDVTGPDNVLERCTAAKCDGEGLDNGGIGTTVRTCTFTGNRIDVANDGTFLEFAASNRFKTGGETTPSQID